jgi:UrcA family protein
MTTSTFKALRHIAARSLAITAIAACGLLSAPIQAEEQVVDIGKTVTTAGLDVSQPAGAQQLYFRLVHAANLVCGHGLRVGLEPVHNVSNCIENSVAAAVRSAHLPQLTMAYQKAHALQAANHEIAVPAIMAAK